jgi:hypothetical protein
MDQDSSIINPPRPTQIRDFASARVIDCRGLAFRVGDLMVS